MKLYKYLSVFLGCLLFGPLFSCSDESPSKKDENFTGIILTVPPISFAGESTRAEEVSQEGWMSNLYLIAIGLNEDGTTRSFNVYDLDTSGTNPQIGDQGTPFYINLYPGKYKFYVLANLDRYLKRFTSVIGFQSEAEIDDMVLNFTPSLPIVPSHLPMACRPTGIKDYSNQPFSEGVVTVVEHNPIHLYADMEFLCSKIRYTILYNNVHGGCSERFGNSSIRFIVNQSTDRPRADYIRKQTLFNLNSISDVFDRESYFLTDASGNEASWILDLRRYEFPMKNDGSTPEENYPLRASDKLTLWDNDADFSRWKASHQRAWQGVVYLPENNSKEDGIRYTELIFPYVIEKYKGEDGNYEDADMSNPDNIKEKKITLFDGNVNEMHYGETNGAYNTGATNDYPHGLVRGWMYDVVAKVVNPDNLEMFIQVYVGQADWVYHEDTQTW